MNFNAAVDEFIRDWQTAGRINSRHTITAYRYALTCLGEDCGLRNPADIDRDNIKVTLQRWSGNTQRARRAALVAFFDWMLEEGYRHDNPARQTRRAKKTPPTVYRLNREEVVSLLNAAQTTVERRLVYLGICAGLRNSEMGGLQGRHFQRPGLVWVSGDIAKGGRERFVPVIGDLQPIWWEIHANVPHDAWVIQSRKKVGANGMSRAQIGRIVTRVGERAGITARVYPHLLRHAFGDHIARYAGMKNAQFLLGHASVQTTEMYTGKPTTDDLAAAIGAFGFLDPAPDVVAPGGLHNAENAESRQVNAFGELLIRLRQELQPVAASLGEGA
jgi:integrase/recombinase XerD